MTDKERARLQELEARDKEVWSNPDQWMKWCDHRVLERAEAAEAQVQKLQHEVALLTEARDFLKQQYAAALDALVRLRPDPPVTGTP